jgi:8-oxo-dGTP pyrophosphatase MutT (NUDIX family)
VSASPSDRIRDARDDAERSTRRLRRAGGARVRIPDGPLRDAAVLVPFVRGAGGLLRLVLVRRSNHGIHGGQLAFPGGVVEPGDASLRTAALREAQEEVGLEPSAVEILADLPTIDTRVSGFRIHPFLARVSGPTIWRPDPTEIAEVIEAPVEDLLRPEAHGESWERLPEWPDPVRIAFYRVGQHRLWGASYHIVRPLLQRVVAGDWPL